MEDEGSSGRIRGRRSLLALEGSYIILLPCPISTSYKEAPICPHHHHLPTTPSRVHRTQCLQTCRSGHWTCLFSCSPAPEEAILAHMQPLRIQVGGIKRVYKCQVEDCKEGPSTSWATICAHIRKVHLGVRLVCPLCGKTFFNPDVLRHHKKTHVN